jgi:RNA polymerase sigma-70 factor (TIGR02960 family)
MIFPGTAAAAGNGRRPGEGATIMTESGQPEPELLARAQAGDGEAFGQLTGQYQRELQVHCYRILGSVADAEDALQETLVAAWRGIGGFEGRSTLRAWLYRIATNQCLNARRGSRRVPPGGQRDGDAPGALPPAGQGPALPAPASDDEPLWLEPCPDDLLGEIADSAPGPEARYEARESVSLAFIAALQHLPSRQRATLVLRDALGFRAAEAAGILGCSLDAVNGSLKRARAALAQRLAPGALSQAPLPGSAAERDVLARFTDAFEAGDIDALVAMLTDDALLTMPPLPFSFRGPQAAAALLSVRVFRGGARRFTLAPARANGQPAFACYASEAGGPAVHSGMIVLALSGARICAVARFTDNALLPRFGFPGADAAPSPGGPGLSLDEPGQATRGRSPSLSHPLGPAG